MGVTCIVFVLSNGTECDTGTTVTCDISDSDVGSIWFQGDTIISSLVDHVFWSGKSLPPSYSISECSWLTNSHVLAGEYIDTIGVLLISANMVIGMNGMEGEGRTSSQLFRS